MWRCLPTASLEPSHTHTHTHLFVPQTGVLCGRHGNSGPPPLSTPSPPLISSSTLHDSPQSVNLELSTCDAIPGTATGGGGEEQEGGRDEERVKQTGWRRRGGLEMKRGGGHSLSLSLSLPLSGWCRGGHYVPSSQTLICIISACRVCINNALMPIHTHTLTHTHTHTHTHSTHRAHRDSAVKSIVCVCVRVRVHVARLVTLLLYYASCYFRSVHECSLCMPTCANEALQGYALSKDMLCLHSSGEGTLYSVALRFSGYSRSHLF